MSNEQLDPFMQQVKEEIKALIPDHINVTDIKIKGIATTGGVSSGTTYYDAEVDFSGEKPDFLQKSLVIKRISDPNDVSKHMNLKRILEQQRRDDEVAMAAAEASPSPTTRRRRGAVGVIELPRALRYFNITDFTDFAACSNKIPILNIIQNATPNPSEVAVVMVNVRLSEAINFDIKCNPLTLVRGYYGNVAFNQSHRDFIFLLLGLRIDQSYVDYLETVGLLAHNTLYDYSLFVSAAPNAFQCVHLSSSDRSDERDLSSELSPYDVFQFVRFFIINRPAIENRGIKAVYDEHTAGLTAEVNSPDAFREPNKPGDLNVTLDVATQDVATQGPSAFVEYCVSQNISPTPFYSHELFIAHGLGYCTPFLDKDVRQRISSLAMEVKHGSAALEDQKIKLNSLKDIVKTCNRIEINLNGGDNDLLVSIIDVAGTYDLMSTAGWLVQSVGNTLLPGRKNVKSLRNPYGYNLLSKKSKNLKFNQRSVLKAPEYFARFQHLLPVLFDASRTVSPNNASGGSKNKKPNKRTHPNKKHHIKKQTIKKTTKKDTKKTTKKDTKKTTKKDTKKTTKKDIKKTTKVNVYKTKKGYYYRRYKNGKSKRISKDTVNMD